MRARWLVALTIVAVAAVGFGCGSGGSRAGLLTDAERAELDSVRPVPGAGEPGSKRMIILGIDGMDHAIAWRMMEEGKLPHFKMLADAGGARPLFSSIPPQSPVAWSNFITGADPGVHGIFDFVHRRPQDYFPYLSVSEATPAPEKTKILGITVRNRIRVPFTDYAIPIESGKVENLRRGVAFWQVLERAGFPCVIFSVPANFPPVGSMSDIAKSISGLGTPDILGTYGTFSYYTTDPDAATKDVSGGHFYPVTLEDGVVHADLYGPPDDFIDYDRIEKRTGVPVPYQSRKTKVPFTVYVDPGNPVVKIDVQGQEFVLSEGEFSDWAEVEFEMLPHFVNVGGIVRFYLKSVRPEFGLYASPIDINPRHQALPITDPSDYGSELVKKLGLFYTQGMAEDTKALENAVFGNKQFIEQAGIVFDERMAAYAHELDNFDEGLLYMYFSSLDQCQHAMWRCTDPRHPAYKPEEDAMYSGFLETLYMRFDAVLAMALEKADENTTVIVLSDHGFAPWYRAFNLNRWLYDEGYIVLGPGVRPDEVEWLSGIDWSRTRAYAFGINGLYLNLAGREGKGIVTPGAEADALVDEIAAKLEAVVDPKNGERVVSNAYKTREVYHGPSQKDAPDIVVGYGWGFRGSDSSATGKIDVTILEDNMKKWSGDHCADYQNVIGVLFANKPIRMQRVPTLSDLAPSILAEFGLPKMSWMVGESVF